jgi:hypothetical protein
VHKATVCVALARGSRRRPEGQVVHRRRRRRASFNPQRAAEENLGRRNDRALPKRRVVDAGNRLCETPAVATAAGWVDVKSARAELFERHHGASGAAAARSPKMKVVVISSASRRCPALWRAVPCPKKRSSGAVTHWMFTRAPCGERKSRRRVVIARLLCPWGGSILRHVVIGLRPGFRSGLRSSALEFQKWTLLMPTTRPPAMKYVVPPIVIPVVLFIGIVAYAMLRPPITDAHPPTPAANSQTRQNGGDHGQGPPINREHVV